MRLPRPRFAMLNGAAARPENQAGNFRSAEIANVIANAMAARGGLAPRRPHALDEGADMRARGRRGEVAHDLLAEQADLLRPRVEIARAGGEYRVAAVAPFADPAQRAIELATGLVAAAALRSRPHLHGRVAGDDAGAPARAQLVEQRGEGEVLRALREGHEFEIAARLDPHPHEVREQRPWPQPGQQMRGRPDWPLGVVEGRRDAFVLDDATDHADFADEIG